MDIILCNYTVDTRFILVYVGIYYVIPVNNMELNKKVNIKLLALGILIRLCIPSKIHGVFL